MNRADLIAALDLHPGSRVNQRVPKKLLLEHAPTPADRRRINEGIDEVQWLAALKPATVGVPSYRDDVREYLEIAVLSVALRAGAGAPRLAELIHRAVPYPVVLISEHAPMISLSMAHKRWSLGEVGATVLDGGVVFAEIALDDPGAPAQSFHDALALARQPHTHLLALYQGWLDTLAALRAARETGTFTVATTPAAAVARREALDECARLDAEISRLRAAATKERQMARQVELNLELKRAEHLRSAAMERL